METEEKQILTEHTQAIKDLIQEFQKCYRVMSPILPEIENTETAKRIKAEREKIKNSNS